MPRPSDNITLIQIVLPVLALIAGAAVIDLEIGRAKKGQAVRRWDVVIGAAAFLVGLVFLLKW